MSTHHRSFLLAVLLPLFLLVSALAVVQAQNAGSPAAQPTNWSNPDTWPNRKVPIAGDKVTIGRDKEVILDVSPPAPAPGAPGGRAGGRGAAPPQPPVVLSRNGREYAQTASNVRSGSEIKVTTERPSMSLILTEMDAGSWVVFELPGFTTAASGTEQSSLDALRKTSDTSYFNDQNALWVKVVSNGNGAGGPRGGGPGQGTSLQVSR